LNGLSIKSNVLCAFPTLLGRVLISDRTIQISDYINQISNYINPVSGYTIQISATIKAMIKEPSHKPKAPNLKEITWGLEFGIYDLEL
jgi:hypothetical protein